MEENPFIGTWRLVTLERRTEGGQVSYPFGQQPVGYIIYNEDGYMSVAIMDPNRPKYASEDIRGGTAEEKVVAADTYVSYCGQYEVVGDKSFITSKSVSIPIGSVWIKNASMSLMGTDYH